MLSNFVILKRQICTKKKCEQDNKFIVDDKSSKELLKPNDFDPNKRHIVFVRYRGGFDNIDATDSLDTCLVSSKSTKIKKKLSNHKIHVYDDMFEACRYNHYEGICLDDGYLQDLLPEDVRCWYGDKFANRVRECNGKWMQIPKSLLPKVEAPKQHIHFDIENGYKHDNDKLWVGHTLANALYYWGEKTAAYELNSQAGFIHTFSRNGQIEAVKSLLRKHCRKTAAGYVVYNDLEPSCYESPPTLDVSQLMAINSRCPALIVPVQEDVIGHTFTVFKGLIFESTQKWALGLYPSSLEWIIGNNPFSKCLEVYEFEEMPLVQGKKGSVLKSN